MASFVELLRLAGTRRVVGKAWGICLQTVDCRKLDPQRMTIAELQRLADVLAGKEGPLFRLISQSPAPLRKA